jgi:catechol 2,3-dioxygenase-like lactoylglutathione lyase family enzyme
MNLNQVTVGSTDLTRSEAFYTLLGLRLIVKTDHYLRFECPDGDTTFSVDLVSGSGEHEQVVMYFECADLDAQCERLETAGVEFESRPEDMSWLWREARLRDPDGHRLCLFHAGSNRHDPPWRLP